jgi:hypothetical protein
MQPYMSICTAIFTILNMQPYKMQVVMNGNIEHAALCMPVVMYSNFNMQIVMYGNIEHAALYMPVVMYSNFHMQIVMFDNI